MPTLEINLAKIRQNTANIVKELGRVEIAAVSKCCQSDIKVVQAMIEGGAQIIADSYLQNLKLLKDFPVKKMLLKAPLRSENFRLLRLIDFVMVSNFSSLELLKNNYRDKKVIGLILSVETGFGREGFEPEELPQAIKLIKNLKHFYLAGIATNTACGALPKQNAQAGQNGNNPLNQLNYFTDLIHSITTSHLSPLTSHFVISGGSSSVLPWAFKKQIPQTINQLRIGEAILLGHDTSSYKPVVNNYTDAFMVKAEVVETRHVMDKYQAVVAIGLNHIGNGNLFAKNTEIATFNKYSDYITVHSKKKIDDEFLYFAPDYYALMALFSSRLVKKVYIYML